MGIFDDLPDAKTETELPAAMKDWKQAVADRDRETLETLYAEAGPCLFSFQGKKDNKAEVIEAISTERITSYPSGWRMPPSPYTKILPW
jgi:hypothetical protein